MTVMGLKPGSIADYVTFISSKYNTAITPEAKRAVLVSHTDSNTGHAPDASRKNIKLIIGEVASSSQMNAAHLELMMLTGARAISCSMWHRRQMYYLSKDCKRYTAVSTWNKGRNTTRGEYRKGDPIPDVMEMDGVVLSLHQFGTRPLEGTTILNTGQ